MLKNVPHLFVNILPAMFKKNCNERGKLLLQDDDPSQNSVKAWSAWDEVGTRKFTIAARSPDLIPIKNIFHTVKQRFCQDALNQKVTQEDFAVSSARIKTALELIPIDVMDRTMLSMNKRINAINKRKGQRTKY